MTTHDPHPQPPTFWRRTLASLVLVGIAALGVAPGATAGPRAKMDRQLRERTSQATDAAPFKVIVTLKKGAKRNFVKALKASGFKLDADFTLTEAFAAQLPAGLLRALENDPDVEAISTDAPVTSMATVGHDLHRHQYQQLRRGLAAPGHPRRQRPGGRRHHRLQHPASRSESRLLPQQRRRRDLRRHRWPPRKADSAITDFDADYMPGTARSWYRISLSGSDLNVTGPVIIDGTSQPGYSVAGGPIIELNAAGVSASDPNGLTLTTGASTVRGLVINRAGDDAIEIDVNAGGSTIVGNYLGTDVSGLQTTFGNGYGITVKSDGNTIGGTSLADRNVIGGNSKLASLSFGIGFWQDADNNVVQGNYIGVGADGTTAMGNRQGITFQGTPDANLIGGTAAGAGNIIANNSMNGVDVIAGTSNAFLGNAIFSNGLLGINLGTAGVTANDADYQEGRRHRREQPAELPGAHQGRHHRHAGPDHGHAEQHGQQLLPRRVLRQRECRRHDLRRRPDLPGLRQRGDQHLGQRQPSTRRSPRRSRSAPSSARPRPRAPAPTRPSPTRRSSPRT